MSLNPDLVPSSVTRSPDQSVDGTRGARSANCRHMAASTEAPCALSTSKPVSRTGWLTGICGSANSGPSVARCRSRPSRRTDPPPEGSVQKAAVRVPPAEPSERQLSLGPRTTIWPVSLDSRAPPSSATSWSRASSAEASGAGLVGPAAFVHLARRNSGQADMRAFSAPDRAVAVPDMRRCASEILAGGDYGRGKKQEHGKSFTAICVQTKAPCQRY